jgi:hypothetical protein
MRWVVSLLVAVLMSLLILGFSDAAALNPYPVKSTGIDVSWPKSNCQAKPPTGTVFGIIGVSGGLDFKVNACLRQEAAWFGNNYSLYLNTGYPGADRGLRYQSSPEQCDRTALDCLAYNYGYNAALYALTYASRQNVHTTNWWLDVETDNSWTDDPAQNIQSLQGMITALQQHTFLPTIGIYAYPGQWNLITDSWHNGLTAWIATGSSSRSAAVADCQAPDFTGGRIIVSQYTQALDEDYSCTAPAI